MLFLIAVALRGDRGLELRDSTLRSFNDLHCGRSSGRSRIGTDTQEDLSQKRIIAVALRGDRGLEPNFLSPGGPSMDCGRSSGRSRIGTLAILPVLRGAEDCGRSSGRSRIGTYKLCQCLELGALRSLFGAIEDWNMANGLKSVDFTRLRSLFGAIEDWNIYDRIKHTHQTKRLRSLFGAIEDWNNTQ